MLISDWSSDLCSSELPRLGRFKDFGAIAPVKHIVRSEQPKILAVLAADRHVAHADLSRKQRHAFSICQVAGERAHRDTDRAAIEPSRRGSVPGAWSS